MQMLAETRKKIPTEERLYSKYVTPRICFYGRVDNNQGIYYNSLKPHNTLLYNPTTAPINQRQIKALSILSNSI